MQAFIGSVFVLVGSIAVSAIAANIVLAAIHGLLGWAIAVCAAWGAMKVFDVGFSCIAECVRRIDRCTPVVRRAYR